MQVSMPTPVDEGPHEEKSRILSLAGTVAVVREVIAAPLARRGHLVETKALGPEALVDLDHYHLVVLELDQRSPDTVSICLELRSKSRVPLLVLVPVTAKGQGVRALELGADSFMLTPFDRRELVARSEALIRRYRGAWPSGMAGAPGATPA